MQASAGHAAADACVRPVAPSLVSYARPMDQEIAETEDGAVGSRAFKEKRKPNWKVR